MIPANLKFQSKVESAPARRYLTQIQPQGGTGLYNMGDTITINIPTRANTALIPSESYLRGQFNLLSTGGASTSSCLESCGWHQFIQRIRVFHGSNLLEDIDNYGQMAKIMYDYQAPEDAVKGRFAITSGTNEDYSVISNTNATYVQNAPLNSRSVNRGRALGALATTAGGTPFTFAINLISLVGALAGEKYLPLWEMTAAPLRVELVLQTSLARAMMVEGGTTQSFTASGINYVGEFLELPDSAIAAIKSASSSPLQVVLPSIRSYTNSAALPAGTQTQVSFPIPAKFSSLKSIVIATRSTAGLAAQYPSSHCAFGVGSANSIGYQFRVGSEVLPSTAPVSFPEIYSEAVKCFGSLADLQLQPSIDNTAFALNLPNTIAGLGEAATEDSGSFLVGIDLEVYQNADKASIFAGTNTNTSDIFGIINYFTASATNILQTAFANYDQVLVFENGVCYARF
jgi:hypothetical protein